MTRDEKIRKVGGKPLMFLGLSQGLFWIGLIVSPLVWIFVSFAVGLKVFLASLFGVCLIAFIYWMAEKVIGDSIDDLEDLRSKTWDN